MGLRCGAVAERDHRCTDTVNQSGDGLFPIQLGPQGNSRVCVMQRGRGLCMRPRCCANGRGWRRLGL